MEGLSSLFG